MQHWDYLVILFRLRSSYDEFKIVKTVSKFCFLLGKIAIRAFKKADTSRAGFEYFRHFKLSELNAEGRPRSGRPSTFQLDENVEKFRQNCDRLNFMKTRALAVGFWLRICKRDDNLNKDIERDSNSNQLQASGKTPNSPRPKKRAKNVSLNTKTIIIDFLRWSCYCVSDRLLTSTFI